MKDQNIDEEPVYVGCLGDGETRDPDKYQIGGRHYKDMPIQPWILMESILTKEEFIGFLKGNAIKYALRAGRKGRAEIDTQKAEHYMLKLKEVQSR
jgi:hypothetical protein